MRAQAKRKSARKLFQATVHVTRTEEWCVEAETIEEARALLMSGRGERCAIGECLHTSVERLDE